MDAPVGNRLYTGYRVLSMPRPNVVQLKRHRFAETIHYPVYTAQPKGEPMNSPIPTKPEPQPPWWWFKLTEFWKGHGTKLIGGAVTALGLVAAGDPSIVKALTEVVGTNRAPGIIVLAAGAMTFYRGFSNTKQAQ